MSVREAQIVSVVIRVLVYVAFVLMLHFVRFACCASISGVQFAGSAQHRQKQADEKHPKGALVLRFGA